MEERSQPASRADQPQPREERPQEAASDTRAGRWFWVVWTALGIGVVLWAAWWVLRRPLSIILPPLAIAGVIVYLLNPLVGWLARRGLPRALGVLAAYLVAGGGVAAVGMAVGPTLVTQTGEFVEQLPEILGSIQDAVNRQAARVGVPSLLQIDPQSPETQEALRDWVASNRDSLMSILRGAGSVLGRLLHLLLVFVLAPVIAFYVLADLPRIRDGITRLLPPGSRSELVDVATRIGGTVGGYFRGQLMVAAFVGLATAAGLALIGLPFWSIVGMLAGLFNLVPFIGPFVGGTIGVVVALTVGGGMGQALAVVAVMVVVQQIDNHVVTPNIIARTVEVHPVTVVLALLVAGSLYGILGMFVAIPVVAATKLLILYVLVTRVPSMRHLAGDGPGLFGEAVSEPPEGSLVARGREMRRAWERRRGPREPSADPRPLPRRLLDRGRSGSEARPDDAGAGDAGSRVPDDRPDGA